MTHVKYKMNGFFLFQNLTLECALLHKIFIATFLAFKRDSTIEIIPTHKCGILSFSDNVCDAPSKKHYIL